MRSGLTDWSCSLFVTFSLARKPLPPVQQSMRSSSTRFTRRSPLVALSHLRLPLRLNPFRKPLPTLSARRKKMSDPSSRRNLVMLRLSSPTPPAPTPLLFPPTHLPLTLRQANLMPARTSRRGSGTRKTSGTLGELRSDISIRSLARLWYIARTLG
jgi:hypothetical protein